MTDKVIRLGHKVDAAVVLQEALTEDFDEILIIAYRKDADAQMYVNSNIEDGGTTLWMLEMCKLMLMNITE